MDPLSSPPLPTQQRAVGSARNNAAAGLERRVPNPLDVFRQVDAGGAAGTGDSGNSDDGRRGIRRSRDTFEDDNPPPQELDFTMPPGFWNDIRPDFSGLVSRLTQRRRLNPDAAADLMQFSQEALGAQVIISHAMMLEIYELLMRQWAAASYQVPEELKININKYCSACVFSPRATAYIPGAIDCVLLSLRGCGVPMPPSDDLARTEIVKSRISVVLIDKRHKMKSAMAKTIIAPPPTPPSAPEDAATQPTPTPPTAGAAPATTTATNVKKVDIATLCRQIVAKCGVHITLDMYHRVAFLRYCLTKYGNTDKFWSQVDARLVQVREKYPSTAQQEQYFRLIYQADVDKYGAPARNGYVLPHQVETWQSTVETRSRDNATRADSPGTESDSIDMAVGGGTSGAAAGGEASTSGNSAGATNPPTSPSGASN